MAGKGGLAALETKGSDNISSRSSLLETEQHKQARRWQINKDFSNNSSPI
jgi:hypothetical protein